MTSPPAVLCFSGHDPSGGAGIQADLETLARFGCHACSVVTALTQQNTVNVQNLIPQHPADFLAQARTLISDLPIAFVKIGLLGSAEIVLSVISLLRHELAGIPVVLDPVLAAGGGTNLAKADLMEVIRHQLLPLCLIATPNIPEVRQLVGDDGAVDYCAETLLQSGVSHVLVTGAHAEDGGDVVNRLYSGTTQSQWSWPRLPQVYHGSGCTLAAAVAGGLARGLSVEAACYEAQRFTWQSLKQGYSLGRGQWLPNRVEADFEFLGPL